MSFTGGVKAKPPAGAAKKLVIKPLKRESRLALCAAAAGAAAASPRATLTPELPLNPQTTNSQTAAPAGF
jgi:hypothetical protein